MTPKLVFVSTCVLLGVACCLLVSRWREAGRTQRTASSAVESLLSGDAKALYELGLSQEKASLSLQQLELVVSQLLKPELSGLTRIAGLDEGQYDGAASATATLRLANGRTTVASIVANETEQGPKLLVLREVLALSWRLRFQKTITGPTMLGQENLAWHGGLRRDRQFLDNIGLHGYTQADGTLVSWDESLTKSAAVLKRIEESVVK